MALMRTLKSCACTFTAAIENTMLRSFNYVNQMFGACSKHSSRLGLFNPTDGQT